MKINKFLQDKIAYILSTTAIYIMIVLMLLAFKVDKSCVIAVAFILSSCLIITLLFEFLRKRTFYNNLLSNIEKLDKSYLVIETLENPDFYEGQLLYEALYYIDKSMAENVKELEYQVSDFKEYIEMWIHEAKIPLSTLTLMVHNHQNDYDKKMIEQIDRINNYIEQVLYFVRSENAEKDYLIKETCLAKVVNHVAMKNKDCLLELKIDLIIRGLNVNVFTDSKWMEFILNQIVSNSIKYVRNDIDSYIKIYTLEKQDVIELYIEDNGIGIPKQDINRVFEKTFTGYNGRIKSKSTGMGLYIADNLCRKLGHTISIESEQNKYTRLCISFAKNNYYDVVR